MQNLLQCESLFGGILRVEIDILASQKSYHSPTSTSKMKKRCKFSLCLYEIAEAGGVINLTAQVEQVTESNRAV